MFEPGNTQADPFFAQGAALVVGGDNDLGEAICVLLAGAGSHVCLACNIDPLAAQRTAARVRALGQEAVVAPVDSSDPQALQAFATAAAAQFGSIHSLVVVPPPQATRARIGDIPPADWARSINAEANGCFNTIHAVLPHLRRARGSCVVLTAAAITKIPAQSSLSNVPKAATSMLVLALAKEEARHGVRANCVAPGWIAPVTDTKALQDGAVSDMMDRVRTSIPLRRLGHVGEVAEVVLFLLSSRASYVTGQAIAVDGGLQI